MKRITAILLALVLCTCALSVCAFATEDTITVRVEIDTDTAPNAWAWGGYGNAFAEWPGEPMTKNGDYWEIKVPVGTTGFIANNGSAQTSDISIAGDADVTIKVAADFSSFEVIGGGKEPAKIDKLFVAGLGTLCGSEWSCDDAANQMTEGSNGIFTKEYKGVAAGDYQLKVTNGTWDTCWGGDGPDGNYAFTLTDTSDVTIKFDSAKYEISVDIVAVGGEPTPPETPAPEKLFVAGVGTLCGSEWSCDDAANQMTEGENGIFTKVYQNVAAGDYSLKVTDGTWTNSWGGDGQDGNYEFSLTEASDVTVKFDVANKQVSVEIGAVQDDKNEDEKVEDDKVEGDKVEDDKTEEQPEETKPTTKPATSTEEEVDYEANKTKTLIIIGTAVLAIVAIAFVLSIPKKIQ